jgi:hypothetical protein
MLIGVGAERGPLALGGRKILDGKWDAVQRPAEMAGLGFPVALGSDL